MDKFDIFLRLNSQEISDIELKFDVFYVVFRNGLGAVFGDVFRPLRMAGKMGVSDHYRGRGGSVPAV